MPCIQRHQVASLSHSCCLNFPGAMASGTQIKSRQAWSGLAADPLLIQHSIFQEAPSTPSFTCLMQLGCSPSPNHCLPPTKSLLGNYSGRCQLPVVWMVSVQTAATWPLQSRSGSHRGSPSQLCAALAGGVLDGHSDLFLMHLLLARESP